MNKKPILIHYGKVIHGVKVGRELGFPTANLDRLPELKIDKGVYVGRCVLEEQKMDDKVIQEKQTVDCLIYFGPRLVFGDTKDVFEAYLYDFNQELYDQNICLELWEYMREPMNFADLADLKKQLEIDKHLGQQILAELKLSSSF